VRKYWRARLAGPPVAVAIVSWWYWEGGGGGLGLVAVAILITIMIDVPFRRSDEYAERIQKAREARRARASIDP
jgi:predicted MFS family arabinose efflux permease